MGGPSREAKRRAVGSGAVALLALLLVPAAAGLPAPRVFEGALHPDYDGLGFHEHGEMCVAETPTSLENTAVDRMHCPTVGGSLAGTFHGLELQSREVRRLRVVVDLDAQFGDVAGKLGLDPFEAAAQWVGGASEILLRDTAVRLEIVALHQHERGANYTKRAGLVGPVEYMELAREFWLDGPPHDLVLILTGQSIGARGMGVIGTAGHPELLHVAFLAVDIAHRPLCDVAPDLIPSCYGPPESFYELGIAHEVSHTLGNRHEFGQCGVQDAGAGCTIMRFLEAPYALRIREFSEPEELVMRGHAETHLLAEPHAPGLVDLGALS